MLPGANRSVIRPSAEANSIRDIPSAIAVTAHAAQSRSMLRPTALLRTARASEAATVPLASTSQTHAAHGRVPTAPWSTASASVATGVPVALTGWPHALHSVEPGETAADSSPHG
jgi:hypothetical protein